MKTLLKGAILLAMSATLLASREASVREHLLEEIKQILEDGDWPEQLVTANENGNGYCNRVESFAAERGLSPFEAGEVIATMPEYTAFEADMLQCIEAKRESGIVRGSKWEQFHLGFRMAEKLSSKASANYVEDPSSFPIDKTRGRAPLQNRDQSNWPPGIIDNAGGRLNFNERTRMRPSDHGTVDDGRISWPTRYY